MATQQTRATGYVPAELWAAFRAGCARRQITASRQLRVLLTRQVEAWALDELGHHSDHPPRKDRHAQG